MLIITRSQRRNDGQNHERQGKKCQRDVREEDEIVDALWAILGA